LSLSQNDFALRLPRTLRGNNDNRWQIRLYIELRTDLIDDYLEQVFILKGNDDLHDARKALPAAARGDAILPVRLIFCTLTLSLTNCRLSPQSYALFTKPDLGTEKETNFKKGNG